MTTHLIIVTGKDTKPETLQTVWLHQWLIQIFSCYVFSAICFQFVLLIHWEKENSSFFVKQECLPANACFILIFTFKISSTCYSCTSTEIKIWTLAFDNSLRSLNKLPGSLHHLSDGNSSTDFPIHLQLFFFSLKEKRYTAFLCSQLGMFWIMNTCAGGSIDFTHLLHFFTESRIDELWITMSLVATSESIC